MPENWKESWKHLSLWMEKGSKTCIAEITVPIRAINSDEIETNIAEWRKYARDFDVTVFENSGHFLSWQYPKKFNESLEKIIKAIDD